MMNRTIKLVVACAAVAICGLEASSATSSYTPRSQSRDKTRQVVGVAQETHLYDMESWWGLFSFMPVFEQSFRANTIAQCLFGNSLVTDCNSSSENTIRIQGSELPLNETRDAKAWLADYFYLSSDFEGTITVEPRIRNLLLDFDFYLGLDEWMCGTYLRVYGPFVHTQWNLNYCEQSVAGTNGYTQGYFNEDPVPATKLFERFAQYAQGETPQEVTGLTLNALKYTKFPCDDRTRNGFADLRAELGWNFLQECNYHLGVNIQGAAPTGNKQDSEFLFDPLVGNGKHWELGAGITGHYVFWRCQQEDKNMGVYVDANFTHLFASTQQRTFDLCGKQNSRYMLTSKFRRKNSLDSLSGNSANDDNPGVPADFIFANEYMPLANLSTAQVSVSATIQSDIVAFLNYSSCGFSLDLGYNFWARSCESIQCPSASTQCTSDSLFNSNQATTWALKGDARMFGFGNDGGTQPNSLQVFNLSATESKATIFGGTNAAQPADAQDPFYKRNFGVDGAEFAKAVINGTDVSLDINTPATGAANRQVKTSIQPIFLSPADLNVNNGTSGLSHKLFAHASYTWDRECWIPFIGLGGFAEFGQNDGDCSSNSSYSTSACATNEKSDDCAQCSLSQWGIWLKAGVSFD